MLKDISLRIYAQSGQRRRVQFFWLIGLMVVNSFAEIISIGSAVPFLVALIRPDSLQSLSVILGINNLSYISDPASLQILLAIVFVATICFAIFVRVGTLAAITKFSFALGADLAEKIFLNQLNKTYEDTLNTHSSEVVIAVTTKTQILIGDGVLACLNLINSALILAMFGAVFVVSAPGVSIPIFGILLALYLVIAKISHMNLIRNDTTIAQELVEINKTLNESLKARRDIILEDSQQFYVSRFTTSNLAYREAQAMNQVITQAPRYIVESAGILLIVIFGFLYAEAKGDFAIVIPFMGAVALAAQRTLPILQLYYSSYTRFKASFKSIGDALLMLESHMEPRFDEGEVLSIRDRIDIDDLVYRYPGQATASIKKAKFTLKKGDFVGVIGSNGSGKSTLADLMMGLLPPTEGQLSVDGVVLNKNNISSWRRNIAHIPQETYVFDATISENIVLHRERDRQKLSETIALVGLEEFVSTVQGGIEYKIGENGINLSGGQKQRLIIARGLYRLIQKNANGALLVLDEATSAIDSVSAVQIIRNIKLRFQAMTCIAITHDTSLLNFCNKILTLNSGRVELKCNDSQF